MRPRGPLDSTEDIDGAAIQTLVLETLPAEIANRALDYRLHFWRTFDGKEVDFVLYGERGLYAIEVKRSSRFREPDLAGLRAFCADHPEAKACLLYGGRQRYCFGKIDVLR